MTDEIVETQTDDEQGASSLDLGLPAIMTAMVDKLTKAFKTDEVIVETSAPIKVHAMMGAASGKTGYRMVTVGGSEDFVLIRARVGKRQKVIFEFSPIAPQEYTQIEFDEDAIFKVFPAIQETVAKCLYPNADDPSGNDQLWDLAKSQFIKDERSRRRKIIKGAERAKQAAEAKAKEETARRNSSNPDWGTW